MERNNGLTTKHDSFTEKEKHALVRFNGDVLARIVRQWGIELRVQSRRTKSILKSK